MNENWIAQRVRAIEVGSIRKVMELAASLKDPVNLEHRPAALSRARRRSRRRRARPSTTTATATRWPRASPSCRARSRPRFAGAFPISRERDAFVTNGTSGGLVLALTCIVNPGDEVIVFDPYFVMYTQLHRPGRRQDRLRRHLSRFPHRRRPGAGRHHAAHQGHHRQQPGQSHRRGLRPGLPARPRPAGPETQGAAAER